MKINNYIYAGDYYDEFLAKHLPEWRYIPGVSGFNMSMVSLDGERELYCVRLTYTIKGLVTRKVVPGYLSDFETNVNKLGEDYAKGTNPRKRGTAFVWDNWVDKTEWSVLFVGSVSDSGLKVDKSIKPHAFKTGKVPSYLMAWAGDAEDFRLIKFGDRILLHDSTMTFLKEIVIRDNAIYTSDSDKSLYNNAFLCPKPKFPDDNHFYFKNPEKNWSLINTTEDKLYFLNWFQGENVLGVSVPEQHRKHCRQFIPLTMKGDLLEGEPREGSKSSFFSFGTPSVSVSHEFTKEFIKKWNSSKKGGKSRSLAEKPDKIRHVIYDSMLVGHTKVGKANEKYNSEFQPTIDYVESTMKKYGNKYRPHLTYDYFMYFMRIINVQLESGKKITKMFISDSFIPLNTKAEHKNKYKFSLVFPVGIIKKNNQVYVSCGEGDFYTTIMSFDEKGILDDCVHDVEFMDLSSYKYTILKY
ncbi:hypothetical protein TetV_093 [Tetraselmis virus 1]|uniref:Uncharacterized protein n=1 Tax=Tetraselmis virus 1 TaxID=2060617 RepID=A0A2P0VMQ2_9VIRU|nr:hypothetical protein QJ968_gp093 [Tetraselmis virus 1]AUF82185.1 hypothetical protein TetV_093 [Tetraselmis virus 1]